MRKSVGRVAFSGQQELDRGENAALIDPGAKNNLVRRLRTDWTYRNLI